MQEKYRLILSLVLLGAFLVLFALKFRQRRQAGGQPQPAGPAPEKISAQEAKEMMDSGEDLVVLDVRTSGEYQEGHIPGALQLAVQDLAQEAEEKLTDKDQKILVYCRSGQRSARAAKMLVQMGYTQVYDLGGILSWPYEIVQ